MLDSRIRHCKSQYGTTRNDTVFFLNQTTVNLPLNENVISVFAVLYFTSIFIIASRKRKRQMRKLCKQRVRGMSQFLPDYGLSDPEVTCLIPHYSQLVPVA